MPIDEEGEAISREDFQDLAEEKKEEIRSESQKIQNEMDQVMRKIRSIKAQAQSELEALEKKIGISVVQPIICHLKDKYQESKAVKKYLEDVQADIADNINRFRKNEEEQQNPLAAMQKQDKDNFLFVTK